MYVSGEGVEGGGWGWRMKLCVWRRLGAGGGVGGGEVINFRFEMPHFSCTHSQLAGEFRTDELSDFLITLFDSRLVAAADANCLGETSWACCIWTWIVIIVRLFSTA